MLEDFHDAQILRSVGFLKASGILEILGHTKASGISGVPGLSVLRFLRCLQEGRVELPLKARLPELRLLLFRRHHDSVHELSGAWVIQVLLVLAHRVHGL